MAKYAEVIVDIPVAKFDKSYDYIIPAHLIDKIEIGMAVKVKFGNRKLRAFILDIKDQTEVQEDKLKKIVGLISREKFFEKSDLKLYRWISDYYCAMLINVIKAAVPTAVFMGNISKKVIKAVKLNITKSEIKKELTKLEKRAPSQYSVLK